MDSNKKIEILIEKKENYTSEKKFNSSTQIQNTIANTKLVYVSFSILEDIVSELTKDSKNKITIKSIIEKNLDHHHFHLSAKQIKDMKTADLILLNGLSFEEELSQVLRKHKIQKTDYVTNKSFLPNEDFKSKDAHIWLSLKYSLNYIQNAASILKQNNIAETEVIEKNLNRMNKEIQTYQEQLVRPQFIKAPIVLSAYDILTHFLEDLNFEIIALNKDHHSNDLNAKNYKKIVDRIKSKDIQYAVTEFNNESKLIEKLIPTGPLKIIGPLCIDSLSEKNGPCPTYIKMLQHNYDTLSKGLLK